MTGRARGVTGPVLVLSLVAAMISSGCGRGAPGHGTPPDTSFAALTTLPGRAPLEVSASNGKLVFAHYCAVCHGETGGGDGFNAYNVQGAFHVAPAAFSDSAFMAGLKDSTALEAIRDGGPAVGKSAAMPPYGHTLSASEIADVWNYARSLASPKHE